MKSIIILYILGEGEEENFLKEKILRLESTR